MIEDATIEVWCLMKTRKVALAFENEHYELTPETALQLAESLQKAVSLLSH